MYLYLGNGLYKKREDIIGVFDMDSATICVATRRFLSSAEKKGGLEGDGELPKSFLLYGKKKKAREKNPSFVYLSRLTSGVLISRTGQIKGMIDEEENG
jgi:hypothetical protein